MEDLFAKTHSIAIEIFKENPDLASPKGLTLRQPLVLFEKDKGEQLRKSG